MFTKFLCILIFLIAASPVLAAPPTLSLAAPPTAYTTEVMLVDARSSTGVSVAPQSDSTPSVIISFGDGYTCNLLACGHAYKRAGTYTITLTGKNASGETATTSASIIVSDIPAAVGGAIQNLTDSGNATTNGTNLQSAITAAAAANTVEQEVRLNGCWAQTIAGPIELSTPAASKYVSIIWTGLTTASGQRVADPTCAPTITAPSSTSVSTAALRTPIPSPSSPVHHYRIVGIRLKKDNDTFPAQRLVDLGQDSFGGGQDTVAKIPHHFIVDRCWFDGGASDTSQTTNGLRVYANYVTVKDSVLAEFRLIGGGVDAAAISLGGGQGPYSFVNNTMVATSENFNVAGGPTAVLTATVSAATTSSATLSTVVGLAVDADIAFTVNGLFNSVNTSVVRSIVGNNITFDTIPNTPNGTAEWAAAMPSFMEFRENYLYKPLKWWPARPEWNGIDYQIKNLWEAKWGRYFVMDGNYLTQTWISSQTWTIALTVRNINGAATHAASLRQLQWTNNIIRNTQNGWNISPSDDGTTQDNTSGRAFDITFRNNLLWNVGVNWQSLLAHAMINLGQADANNKLRRIYVIHNTYDNGVPDNINGTITDFAATGGAIDSLWLNNVSQDCGAGFRSNFSNTNSAQNIINAFPPGDSTNWNKNMIVNINGHTYPAAAILHTANWSNATFINYVGGDFTLVPTSPGKNAATDGTDVGVNMITLHAATLHTEDGQWSTSTTLVCRWSTNPACSPN